MRRTLRGRFRPTPERTVIQTLPDWPSIGKPPRTDMPEAELKRCLATNAAPHSARAGTTPDAREPRVLHLGVSNKMTPGHSRCFTNTVAVAEWWITGRLPCSQLKSVTRAVSARRACRPCRSDSAAQPSHCPNRSRTAWHCGAWPRSAASRVVSKRRDVSYRSGDCRDWRKVKTVAWREANKERWRFFERG